MVSFFIFIFIFLLIYRASWYSAAYFTVTESVSSFVEGCGGGQDFPMVINNVSYYYCCEKWHLHFGHTVPGGYMQTELQWGVSSLQKEASFGHCLYERLKWNWLQVTASIATLSSCHIIVGHLFTLYSLTLFQWLKAWIMHLMTLSAGGCSCLWPQFCMAGGQLKKKGNPMEAFWELWDPMRVWWKTWQVHRGWEQGGFKQQGLG